MNQGFNEANLSCFLAEGISMDVLTSKHWFPVNAGKKSSTGQYIRWTSFSPKTRKIFAPHLYILTLKMTQAYVETYITPFKSYLVYVNYIDKME